MKNFLSLCLYWLVEHEFSLAGQHEDPLLHFFSLHKKIYSLITCVVLFILQIILITEPLCHFASTFREILIYFSTWKQCYQKIVPRISLVIKPDHIYALPATSDQNYQSNLLLKSTYRNLYSFCSILVFQIISFTIVSVLTNLQMTSTNKNSYNYNHSESYLKLTCVTVENIQHIYIFWTYLLLRLVIFSSSFTRKPFGIRLTCKTEIR